MEVTVRIDDVLLSQIKEKAQGRSVQHYIEDLLHSTFFVLDKRNDNVKSNGYEVSPFVKSLSLKGGNMVPNDVDGIDSLIDLKYTR